jgi:hypothetical protein
MFDVKGLSCALFFVTLVPTANMEALWMIHYGSFHLYVYGSNKADLNSSLTREVLSQMLFTPTHGSKKA